MNIETTPPARKPALKAGQRPSLDVGGRLHSLEGDAMPESKHTPGPWSWFGNTDTGEALLATTHSGRVFVLRLGSDKSARKRPCFLVQPTGERNGMQPLTDFVKYEVCPEAGADRANPGVYRADFREVTHPDLMLIAASPELLEACKLAVLNEAKADELRNSGMVDDVDIRALRAIAKAARAAIAKAEGK